MPAGRRRSATLLLRHFSNHGFCGPFTPRTFMVDGPRSRLPYNDAILDGWWSPKIKPRTWNAGASWPTLRSLLLRGCRRAPLCIQNSSCVAMVALLKLLTQRNRRNQLECSILYRLLLLMGARYFGVERCRKATITDNTARPYSVRAWYSSLYDIRGERLWLKA